MPANGPESTVKPLSSPDVKTALITGITGQDGAYLAELLLDKGYKVYGLVRDVRGRSFESIHHLLGRINIVEGSIEYFPGDQLLKIQPDEIYNLAASSFVGASWEEWQRYQKVNGEGAVNVFESARRACPKTRIYQASSSELFGASAPPQSESTPMVPRSPYGASKLYAHSMARIYRESYGLFISCGICFNHESPRRGTEFLSRKVAQAVATISHNGGYVKLGDLAPKRDWGHASDYVRAMWMMLQAPGPDDYVVASGEAHSVQDFMQLAFSYAGLNWRDHYELDPLFKRPSEVFDLCGDSSKIRSELGWSPDYKFDDLVREMVLYELEQWNDKQKRQESADLHARIQSESSGPPLRGGLPRSIGSFEEDLEGAGSNPPDVKPLG